MRMPLLLTLILLAQGCLYIGGINHNPDGEISIESASARLEVNGSVTLKASVTDPDDDPIKYQWRVAVVDSANDRYALTRASRNNELDINYLRGATPRVIGEASSLTLNLLPLRGTYTATLRFEDDRGADQVRSKTFTVKNTAPSGIKIMLQADDAYRDLVRVPDVNGSYPAHAYYPARVAEVTDLEGDLRCGKGGGVTWSLSHGTALTLQQKEQRPCQYGEKLPGLRFRFKPTALTQGVLLQIKATVTDGQGGEGVGQLSPPVTLAPNRPPCITGSDPPLSTVASVPVQSALGRRFEATHVSDDVLLGTRYSWAIRPAGDKTFIELPGQTGAAFQMPAWFRLPGDAFELRVRVTDDMAPWPTCGDSALCAPHTGLPPASYQGITSKVRMI